MVRILVALACAACSGPSQPAPAPPGSPAPEPPPPPPPSADAPTSCTADPQHCCLADGTLAKPGGCQPSYPDGVVPATIRGPDGTCTPIECHKRCLPADARIATPAGDIVVTRLRVGDIVWSTDVHGARIAVPLLAVSSVAGAAEHSIVELALRDGRTVRASAAHPLADGTLAGSIGVGTIVDGAAVVTVRRTRYVGATWDVLPASATGTYWADGVRLGSTLR